MKKTLVLVLGFTGYFFMEGFVRLIIMFYHRDQFQYYGVENLPAEVWIPVIYFAVLVNTWLVAMVVLSVIKEKPLITASQFAALFIVWRAIEIVNSYGSEPAWYLFTIPLVHITAIYLSFKIYIYQNAQISNS